MTLVFSIFTMAITYIDNFVIIYRFIHSEGTEHIVKKSSISKLIKGT